MPVNVTMPDGSVRKFPSRKRLVVDAEDFGEAPRPMEEPEASLTWRFAWMGDTWCAMRR